MDPTDADRNQYQFEISLPCLCFRSLFLQESTRQAEVGRPRNFNIPLRAAHDRDRMPESLHKAGFIGAVILILGGAIECLFQNFCSKYLRCLRSTKCSRVNVD